MSHAIPPRSSTGCLTCKTRRKKCDETKPKCLRCQRLGVECPGYVYVPLKDKRVQRLRTLPAPRRVNAPVSSDVPGDFATEYFTGPSLPSVASPDASSTTPQRDSAARETTEHPIHQDESGHITPNPIAAGHKIDFSWVNNSVGDFSLDALSDPWMHPPASNQPQIQQEQIPSIFDVPLSDQPQFTPLPSDTQPVSMTAGQASLLQDLFSLGNSQDTLLGSTSSLVTSSPSSASIGAPPSWLSPLLESDETDDEDEEDPEGAMMIISRMPALDPNVESNTLPFLLQNYAAWITRRAFEPLKMTNVARDMVFNHFGGGEEARWALTLLANIGRTFARTNGIPGEQMSMLYALQDSAIRQAATIGTLAMNDASRNASIRVLDIALEAISAHYYVSPIPQAETLRRALAPVFRRLCPDPPGAPINLPGLMNQPLFCLQHYAYLDILVNVMAGFPMNFRYDTTRPNDDPVYESILEIRADGSPQWLMGIPDRLVFVFARINGLREDGAVPSPELVLEIEEEIRGFRPFQSISVDSSLMVTRLMVQECWRHFAYIYLYMALCGESSEGPRVKAAMKQFMNLVNGTKPGRFPDEFLALCFMVASPAARRPADRQVLIKRIIDQSRSREVGTADNLRIIEDFWTRAAAEGRPVVWSDIIVSRIRVVGM